LTSKSSENNPYASRAVMLAAAACRVFAEGAISLRRIGFGRRTDFPRESSVRWRRRSENLYRSVQRHAYFALPRTLSLPTEKANSRGAIQLISSGGLLEIAAAARGSIYITAEELEHDVEFTAVDELYRGVGTATQRDMCGLAYRANKEEPIGAAIAYEDLWVSISAYLENRCEPAPAPDTP